MKNAKKLYIDIHKEYNEPNDIRFENLGYFFDKESRIGIKKIYIECDLEVGFVYDFTYEDYNDTDTYSYKVLKKDGCIYYIAEYYDRFYEYEETELGDVWEKCNIKEKLGIDIEKWKTVKYKNTENGVMTSSKLVQKVKWDLDGLNTEMYMYGEANFEANKAMQEPLEKLYQYENLPDMRDKVREYIGELETEIKRLEDAMLKDDHVANIYLSRMSTLQEVINDLKSRLGEIV